MRVPIELKRNYLTRKLRDIKNLMILIEEEDFASAIRLGHQVKGNAVTFEMPHIAYIGHEIENAAKRRDKDRVKILLMKMESIIKQTQF
ncbi:MAG: Hpt domain-containing protein [Bacteriovoracaceae bacterium]